MGKDAHKHGKHGKDERGPRKPRVQHVGTVVRTQRVAEHLVRVTLGGPGLAAFEPKEATDQYVKLLFADPALGLTPPYDLDAIRAEHGKDAVPVRRTYTVRAARDGEIDVDFVTHGAEGIAGPWAEAAQPGDLVAFNGPGGAYAPRPGVWQLLAGDESALPAIAAALESMGPDEHGEVLLDVGGPGDEIELQVPAGVRVQWLHRGGAFSPETSRLESAVREVDLPSGAQVFAHGERGVMKALRRYFTDEFGLSRADLSLSAYWAYGRVEDQFQAEKREAIGQIFPEGA